MKNDDLLHAKDGGIERLLYIMRRLRDPDTGCPWDIEQDFSSIAPYTIEEAYEVADAIARDDMADLKGELGDYCCKPSFILQSERSKGFSLFRVSLMLSATKWWPGIPMFLALNHRINPQHNKPLTGKPLRPRNACRPIKPAL